MKDIDPNWMLACGEAVGKSLWGAIRMWTIRLGVIFGPIYAMCFGARSPEPVGGRSTVLARQCCS